MFTITCCLVVKLGLCLGLGIDLVSGWQVVMHTYFCATLGWNCRGPPRVGLEAVEQAYVNVRGERTRIALSFVLSLVCIYSVEFSCVFSLSK